MKQKTNPLSIKETPQQETLPPKLKVINSIKIQALYIKKMNNWEIQKLK